MSFAASIYLHLLTTNTRLIVTHNNPCKIYSFIHFCEVIGHRANFGINKTLTYLCEKLDCDNQELSTRRLFGLLAIEIPFNHNTATTNNNNNN